MQAILSVKHVVSSALSGITFERPNCGTCIRSLIRVGTQTTRLSSTATVVVQTYEATNQVVSLCIGIVKKNKIFVTNIFFPAS